VGRWWRRLLGLDADAFLVVLVIVGGRLWHPLPVLVTVAEVAGAPFGVPHVRHEPVLVRGGDGVRQVTPQVHREQGTPPCGCAPALLAGPVAPGHDNC
jgi:hypothetical protein